MCNQCEKPKFYITTPIYYPSGNMHIGHTYTTVAADTMTRFKKLTGYDTYFLTGTDEHGQKIERKAAEAGVTPQQFVDKIVAETKELWKLMDIQYDDFIRTTDERHVKIVQKIFRQFYDQGDIYKSEYEGLYCAQCEAFWTPTQVKEDPKGGLGLCPDCGRPVEKAHEESYFFRMSKYQDWLIDYIETHPDFIQPQSRANEMLTNFLRPGLQDLCVSRTSFKWGVPVDFDDKHVVYVWIDALSNYITALGYGTDHDELFKKYWPADIHLVGKEIVRFHTIIWPCILMALDLPLPKKVYGHGWLIVDGDKMSKSKGNVVDPNGLIDEFGADAIRYFLLREINLGQDGNFSRDALIQRINSDLANDLGNLLHRTLNMTIKFQDGVLLAPQGESEVDKSLKADAKETVDFFEKNMKDMQLSATIKKVWAFISRANKYIDETTPWALAKDPAKKQELANVMYNLAESLRVISVLISPFMPVTAERIWKQLNLPQAFKDVQIEDIESWGGVPAGLKVGEPEQLFPRIEVEKEAEEKPAKKAKQEKAAKQKKAEPKEEVPGVIGIEDFGKVKLRVAEVVAAEPVPKADKLLKLQLSLGEGQPQRQVVSGIAQFYQPDELVGKHVVLVANLKPAKLRGVVSEGMILAASDGKGLKVLEVNMPAGTEVR